MKMKNSMKSKKIAIIALTIVIAVVSLLMLFNANEKVVGDDTFLVKPKKSLSVKNTYQPKEQFAYSFSIENNGEINSGLFQSGYDTKTNNTGGKIPVKSKISARLNIKFIEENNDSQLYFAQLSDLKSENGIFGENKGQLVNAFPLILSKNGLLTLYDAEIIYNEEFRNLISQLLPYLQIVGQDAGREKWKTRERDLVGSYKSEYTLNRSDTMITIKKHKFIYDKTNKLPALFKAEFMQAQARVINHNSVIKLNKNALWANEIKLFEQIALESGSQEISDIATQFSALYTEFDSSVKLPKSLVELKAILAKKTKRDYYHVENNSPDLIGIKNLNELFEYYSKLFATNEFLAKEYLVNYLRLHPEKSVEFVDYINANQDNLTDAQEVKLWSALAKAGHKEAQAAYIYALQNPEFRQIIQYRAIGHVRLFEQPTEKFVESLWKIQEELSSRTDKNNGDNEVLASGALFAIATLTTSEQIDDKVKASIVSNLKEKLHNASDDWAKADLLIAMGNTHNDALMENVSPYLDSTNERLRENAFKAIARMPDVEAVTLLTKAYERISSDNQTMQTYALNNLQKMTMTKESIDWVSKKALELNNKTETKRLINILGNNMSNFPIAETTLRELSEKDIYPQLKSDIYSYITPVRQ